MITPNPFTSGGARWNLMAAYGSQIAQGKSEEEALDFVAQILENTPVQDASARDSLQTFIGGKGDVVPLLRERGARRDRRRRGARVHHPRRDDPDRDQGGRHHGGRRSRGRAGVPRLPAHRRGPARSGPRTGYRPVNEEILAEYEEEFPQPKELFTIEEFGGWETVATEFFDPAEGSVAEIERNLGVATE